MELQATLLDLLEQAHRAENSFIADLSQEERLAAGTPQRWSAKDLMAHVAAWKGRMARALADEGGADAAGPWDEDLDHTNEAIFRQCQDWSWDEVQAECDREYSSLIAQVRGLGEEDLAQTGVSLWQGERPLWRTIVGTGYSHPVAHLAEHLSERGRTVQADELQEEAAIRLISLDGSPGWRGVARYNLACHYALTDRLQRAIDLLREALQLNPDLVEWSRQDSDLASIRDEPGYLALYRA